MVNIRSQLGDSKYIKAAELQGRDVTLTISGIRQEELENDGAKELKWVLYFQGTQKGLVLNVTNGNTVADQLGDETDGWIGRQITLFPTQVDFGGKQVLAIRVRMQTAADFQAPPVAQPVGGALPPVNPPAGYVPGPGDPNNVGPADTFDQNTGGGQGPVELSDEIPFSPEWR